MDHTQKYLKLISLHFIDVSKNKKVTQILSNRRKLKKYPVS